MAGVRGIEERLTNSRDGGDDLSELQLVQDGRLTSRIQTDLFKLLFIPYANLLVLVGPTINIPMKNQIRQNELESRDATIDGRYIRISFLPKRPERRRETERPMIGSTEE